MRIEEHYTDTGGVTDHVFGLCPLFGFRFAPRIRDLKDRRLYLFLGQKAPLILDPLMGGYIDHDHIAAHWEDVLRLGTSIRSGNGHGFGNPKPDKPEPNRRFRTRSALGRAGYFWMICQFTSARIFPQRGCKLNEPNGFEPLWRVHDRIIRALSPINFAHKR